MSWNRWIGMFAICASSVLLAGCAGDAGTGGGGGEDSSSTTSGGSDTTEVSQMEGDINVDGSSTVFPITEAIADGFRVGFPKVKVTVGVSGTGGGFKRFTKGDTDISDASRPIKSGEYDQCKANKIKFVEVPVAYDGRRPLLTPFRATLILLGLGVTGLVLMAQDDSDDAS